MTPAAMLLAAGYGTRLEPLTRFRPKPLVPVGNRPLLDWHLDTLRELGVAEVALNTSHLAEQVADHVDKRGKGLPRVDLIREEAPLGVGGGLLGARGLLAGESWFLVVNADIFHAIDLPATLATHESTGADATIVVRRAGPDEPHDELTIGHDGVVTGDEGIGGATNRWRFAGIHVLTPAVFDHLTTPGSLRAGYERLLADGAKIMAHDCGDAIWFDIGTLADYLEANHVAAQTASKPPPTFAGVEIAEPALVDCSVQIGIGCSVGPHTVIGEGASIGSRSRLLESVVWPGVSIPADSTLRRCVAYPAGILTVADRA